MSPTLSRPASAKRNNPYEPWRRQSQVSHQTEATPPKDEARLDGRRGSLGSDMLALAQFVASGYLYKQGAKEAAAQQAAVPPLSDTAAVKLEDPLVIVPGWTTQPEKFDHLVAHLMKSGQNGERPVYIKEGAAFTDKACTEETQIRPDDKVFVAVFDNVLSPPDKTAPQLEKILENIKATVGEKVDVLGYSMGGIAVRQMLNEHDEKIDQVAFLGSPHRGTRFAHLARYVVHRDINWAMSMANIGPTHLPAMNWMQPWDGTSESNPNLHRLNTNVEHQLSQTNQALSLGTDGLATVDGKMGQTEGGDGLVGRSSLQVEGLPTEVLHGRGNKQHGNLVHDTEIFDRLADYYQWERVG